MVEDGCHVVAHVGVGILVDAQSATGVLAKDVDDARLGKRGQLPHDLVRHQMEATRLGMERNFYLLYHIYSI